MEHVDLLGTNVEMQHSDCCDEETTLAPAVSKPPPPSKTALNKMKTKDLCKQFSSKREHDMKDNVLKIPRFTHVQKRLKLDEHRTKRYLAA